MHILTKLDNGFVTEMKCRDLNAIPDHGSLINTAYEDNVLVDNVTGMMIDGVPQIYCFKPRRTHGVTFDLQPYLQPLESASRVEALLRASLSILVEHLRTLEPFASEVNTLDTVTNRSYIDAFVSIVTPLVSRTTRTAFLHHNRHLTPNVKDIQTAYNVFTAVTHAPIEHLPDGLTIHNIITLRNAVTALLTLAFDNEENNEEKDWLTYPVFCDEDDDGNVTLNTQRAISILRESPAT